MTMPADPVLDPLEVMVGTANGPGIWIAPERTPAPADLTAPFEAPWVNLGYAADDGVTLGGATTSESFTPWQSKTPIRTIVTERTQTVQFIMWQLNETTLGLYFDADVPPAAAGIIEFEVRSDAPSHTYAVCVDLLDGESQFRHYFPRANLETAGDMALTKGALVPLDVTLSALDDNGVLSKKWLKSAGLTTVVTETTSGRRTSTSSSPSAA
jgi:hypothetical protein